MAYHEEDAEALLTSPLLAIDGVPAEEEPAAPANVKLELRGLLLLSAPVMVQLSAQYAVTVVNQYFIGHQGAGPLAAAAIGNTVSARSVDDSGFKGRFEHQARSLQWFNVCWYFLMGVSTALDTLGSQGSVEPNNSTLFVYQAPFDKYLVVCSTRGRQLECCHIVLCVCH